MVHGVFDPQYQGYGEKFLVRSYLKELNKNNNIILYNNNNNIYYFFIKNNIIKNTILFNMYGIAPHSSTVPRSISGRHQTLYPIVRS
jgi:hypothetical protein